MRRFRQQPRAPGGLAAVALAAGLLAGCGSSPRPTEPSPASDLARPAVDMAGLGLEVRGWLVDDRDHRLAQALADDEARDALGTGDRAWTSCGVRVVEVPVENLPGLYDALAIGPERRLWLGQATQWTEAYAASETRSRTGVAMPEGELSLEPGVLRLLVRCWVERRLGPAADGAADARETSLLRVDLLPQNRETGRSDLTLEPPDPTKPLELGLVFERLRCGWSSDGSRALILAPANPGEDWAELARVMGPIPNEPESFGPSGTPLPTLGEALLNSGRPGFRIVLVLIPRTSVEAPAGAMPRPGR